MAPAAYRNPVKSALSDDITPNTSFVDVVRRLCSYLEDELKVPYAYQKLRAGAAAQALNTLVHDLSTNCHHAHLVHALLVLRWHYKDLDQGDQGINLCRGLACEIVAWKLVLGLSIQDRVDVLLGELPTPGKPGRSQVGDAVDEATSLLLSFSNFASNSSGQPSLRKAIAQSHHNTFVQVDDGDDTESDPTRPFCGLNALEIATIAQAKKFLSYRVIQRTVDGIWHGNIVFWESMNSHTKRKACFYNKHTMDPYSRLRVPKYQKTFEAVYLLIMLALYYKVMLEDNSKHVTPAEILLYIWIAGFGYDELGTWLDSGSLLYAADLWNMIDVSIILIAVAFLVTRSIGLAYGHPKIIDTAFDILSLMAIPLIPRVCSLSLHPYFGILIPGLQQMTKDLMKFLVIVLLIYCGFATTFVLLARNTYSAKEICWLLVYVFNGSGYMGLDMALKISETLGPGLMVVFVCITNILLLPTLISILTNSLTHIMTNAREEFLFQYSILVLEAATSKRLTYFFPPLNLVPLILLRPLRLVVSEDHLRPLRIFLLKATHFHLVACIWLYESTSALFAQRSVDWRASRPGLGRLSVARHPQRVDGGPAQTPSEHALPLTHFARVHHEARKVPDNDEEEDRNELRHLVKGLRAQIEQLESHLGVLKT